MIQIPTWVIERGPWAILALLVMAFIFARSRGILVTGAELDRLERRMEKDTDRVLALYDTQLKLGAEAGRKKDETIARQAEQIEKLMSHSAVSSHALKEIMEEAKRRGILPKE